MTFQPMHDLVHVQLHHRADIGLTGQVKTQLMLPGDSEEHSDRLHTATMLAHGPGRAIDGVSVPPIGPYQEWEDGAYVAVAQRFGRDVECEDGQVVVNDYDVVARLVPGYVPWPNWGYAIIEREAPHELEHSGLVLHGDDVISSGRVNDDSYKKLSLGRVAAIAPELMEETKEGKTISYEGVDELRCQPGVRVVWEHKGARALAWEGVDYFVCNARNVLMEVPSDANVELPFTLKADELGRAQHFKRDGDIA